MRNQIPTEEEETYGMPVSPTSEGIMGGEIRI